MTTTQRKRNAHPDLDSVRVSHYSQIEAPHVSQNLHHSTELTEVSQTNLFSPHGGYGNRTQYSSATPLRITRKLLYFLQASPLFKNYLLATPLTEKEGVVSWLSAFSRFFLFFLLTKMDRYVVCLPAASLRPPFYFIVVVGSSALLDLFIRHRTFSMKEDKVYASQKARADSVHQFLAFICIEIPPRARFERKNSSLHNSQSYSISKDLRHFFPVPVLGTLTSVDEKGKEALTEATIP